MRAIMKTSTALLTICVLAGCDGGTAGTDGGGDPDQGRDATGADASDGDPIDATGADTVADGTPGTDADGSSVPPGLQVTTESGDVTGVMAGETRAFLGVPYAASTAGENRWRPAQAPAAWTTPRPAIERGAPCPGYG